jgi:peptidoglycan/xylan/chitin deacetylase (PgdA/CDA1 family)
MAEPNAMCLCYHAVSSDWPCSLAVAPDRLEHQLTFLLRRGYEAATFTEAVVQPSTRRTLAVTFDDAYASVIDRALPILSKLGIPATVFAPTGFMSARQAMSWPGIDQWAHSQYASELTSMDWRDLTALADQGWEIGSHSHTHPDLAKLDGAELSAELERSRSECEANLRRPCTSLAYPYGSTTGDVVDAAREAGYAAAATLGPSPQGVADAHWYPRVGIYHADSDVRFAAKVLARRFQGSRLWRVGASLLRGQA